MIDTKEKILLTALKLFSVRGFKAVSVNDIASELGITKGALYKHYKSKNDIFESIIGRMENSDSEKAYAEGLPDVSLDKAPEKYKSVQICQTINFARDMFRYWTEDDFPAAFRRMLTLEQYGSDKMRALYCQYLSEGPLGYLTDIFSSIRAENARKMAIELYAPMFLFYSVYDASSDKQSVSAEFELHLKELSKTWKIQTN